MGAISLVGCVLFGMIHRIMARDKLGKAVRKYNSVRTFVYSIAFGVCVFVVGALLVRLYQ